MASLSAVKQRNTDNIYTIPGTVSQLVKVRIAASALFYTQFPGIIPFTLTPAATERL